MTRKQRITAIIAILGAVFGGVTVSEVATADSAEAATSRIVTASYTIAARSAAELTRYCQLRGFTYIYSVVTESGKPGYVRLTCAKRVYVSTPV